MEHQAALLLGRLGLDETACSPLVTASQIASRVGGIVLLPL